VIDELKASERDREGPSGARRQQLPACAAHVRVACTAASPRRRAW
jgi:hypothetical protein